VRRVLVVLAATLSLVVPTLLATPSASAADGGYDRGVGQADCDLTGRVHVSGKGCSRTRCVPGAKRYRRSYGAEACRLRTETRYGFVATIESRRCTALGRRWMASVNYCAAYPDRSPTAVYDAPQCTGARSVYVPLSEKEGYYDECLTPLRVRELQLYARLAGTSLTTEAAARSSVQCAWRPERTYANGRCVATPGSRPARGGVVMVGDSLTWRGSDELTRRRPALTVDGEPARQLSALKGRLDAYTALRGAPTGVIIALGAVPPPPGFDQSDLARVVRSLPRSTKVMLVLPYAEVTPGKQTANTLEITGWMRGIAKSRSRTCLAAWPAYVVAHPGILADGVHVRRPAESSWAAFVDRSWARC
jgi:hypothetical protein